MFPPMLSVRSDASLFLTDFIFQPLVELREFFHLAGRKRVGLRARQLRQLFQHRFDSPR